MSNSKSEIDNGIPDATKNTSVKQAEVLTVPGFNPSLIDGENAANYEAFKQDCLRAVAPKDALERVWVQDFIDYTWESQRLRRMKVTFLHIERKKAVESIIRKIGPPNRPHKEPAEISHSWSGKDPVAHQYVKELLETHELTLDSIMAETIINNIDTLETIDSLISSYEHRRDASIRELEKRRDNLAKRAREFTNSLAEEADVEIIDAT